MEEFFLPRRIDSPNLDDHQDLQPSHSAKGCQQWMLWISMENSMTSDDDFGGYTTMTKEVSPFHDRNTSPKSYPPLFLGQREPIQCRKGWEGVPPDTLVHDTTAYRSSGKDLVCFIHGLNKFGWCPILASRNSCIIPIQWTPDLPQSLTPRFHHLGGWSSVVPPWTGWWPMTNCKKSQKMLA